MSELLKAKIDVPCPECGVKIRPTLGDIQRGRTVTCPRGHRVTLTESGNSIKQADRALDGFKRSIERMNRR